MSPQKTASKLLLIYAIIIIISIAGNFFFIDNSDNSLSGAAVFTLSIATSTLTHEVLAFNFIPSISHILFKILIIQLAGLLFNTTLFWQCRQIFGNTLDRLSGFRDAFMTTFWITLISQAFLVVFFIYSIPASEVPEGRKIWAALATATGSFHLGGIPFYDSFFSKRFLEQNFVVQLGITGGITLGSLGIFVIHELFSIPKLRQRLADTSIDWSFITKVSVLVGGSAIVLSSILYWFMEKDRLLAGKNITESAIATVYEVSTIRGFGVNLYDPVKTEPLTSFVSIILTGPFSNGGGLTLLVIIVFAFLFKSIKKSTEVRISGRLLWKLSIISGIILTLASFGILLGTISLPQVIPTFTNNSVAISPDITWDSGLLLSWLMLTGKLAFVVAAFRLISLAGKLRA